MGLCQNARLRFGLKWKEEIPAWFNCLKWGLQVILALFLALAIYGWTMERDLADKEAGRPVAATSSK